MNSYERKALKRAKESQARWRKKAIERNKRLRAAKFKIRDLERSRQKWRERYEAAQDTALNEQRISPPN